MGRITEFKLRAVITSTGQEIEGFYPVPHYAEMVESGMSEAEIQLAVMDEWLATQVSIVEAKKV